MVKSWVTIMAVASLAVSCGSDEGAAGSDQAVGDTTTTTTTTTTTVVMGGATTTTSPATTTPAAGTATVETGFCASGTYDLDGDSLLADVAAASAEGGAGQVVSGGVVLELREDQTALVDFQEWTFRLSFPGQSDTVLGTQTGQVTGTWSVDETGAHRVELVTEAVSATFVLETAQGSMPVPSGEELAPLGSFDMRASCTEPDVVIVADDAALGVAIEWSFIRRA